MKTIAKDFLHMDQSDIETIVEENKDDEELLKRNIITRWGNMNSEDQLKVS